MAHASKQYTEIVVLAHPNLADRISAVLWEAGTLGISLDEDAETGALRMTAFFPESADLRSVLAEIRGLDRAVGIVEKRITPPDWPEQWRRYFTGFPVGNALYIAPSWEKARAKDDVRRNTIIIEPGMAFGTGQHATTALCLERIEAARPLGRRCGDLGTGSGILAVAACRLGASRVVAVDCDPDVYGNFRVNLGLNNVGDRIQFVCGTPECLQPRSFDMIFSNITLNTLCGHAAAIKGLVGGHGGKLILSGFLEEDIPAIVAAFSGAGASSWSAYVREGWGAVELTYERPHESAANP